MSEREIFDYEYKGEKIYADPLAINRRLTLILGTDLNSVLADCASKEFGIAEQAIDKMRIATCMTFKLGEPFDPKTGQGVMEETWIEICQRYVDWLEKKNPSSEKTPTSPPSTGSTSSVSPTKSASDCGCTSPVSGLGSPTLSEEETVRRIKQQLGQTP